MDMLKGYRTVIIGALTVLFAVLGGMGVEVPAEAIDQYGEAILGVVGAVMVLLRLVTDGPMGDLRRFFRKDK